MTAKLQVDRVKNRFVPRRRVLAVLLAGAMGQRAGRGPDPVPRPFKFRGDNAKLADDPRVRPKARSEAAAELYSSVLAAPPSARTDVPAEMSLEDRWAAGDAAKTVTNPLAPGAAQPKMLAAAQPATAAQTTGPRETARTVRGLVAGGGANDWVGRRIQPPEAPHHTGLSALSAEGRRLISVCSDSSMRCWDLWAEGEAAACTVLRTYAGAVSSCALSADGATLVVGSQLGSLRVWRLADGNSADAPAEVLRGHNGAVRCTALSADGTTLITVGSILRRSETTTVMAWDLRKGTSRQLWGPGQFPELMGSPAFTSCSISADGSRVAAGADDHAVWVWDVSSGGDCSPMVVLHGHQGAVTSCSLSADGLTLISGSVDKCLRVWDLDGRRRRDTLVLKGHGEGLTCCALSSDGSTAVTGSEDGATHVWSLIDVYAGRSVEPMVLVSPPGGQVLGRGAIRCCEVDANGSTVVSIGANERVSMVWDLIYRRSSRLIWDVLYRGGDWSNPDRPAEYVPEAVATGSPRLAADLGRLHLRLNEGAAASAAAERAGRDRDRMKQQAAHVAVAEAAAARQQHAPGVTLDRGAAATQGARAACEEGGLESTETELWTRSFLSQRSGDALKRLWGVDDATARALTEAPLGLEDLEDESSAAGQLRVDAAQQTAVAEAEARPTSGARKPYTPRLGSRLL